jgi:hypothetical protein
MKNRFGEKLILGGLMMFAVSAASNGATIERVIHISVDGLNATTLYNLSHASPAAFPAFTKLETEGAFTYNARTDFDFTETVPNHISMVTGRPVLQVAGQLNTLHHGISTNFPQQGTTIHRDGNDNVPYKSSVFDVVHDAGLGTAFYASKTRMSAIIERSYNATNGAIDTTGADNGRDKIDNFQNSESNSSAEITAYLAAMTATPRHYSFIHIVDPDLIGHPNGWDSEEYEVSVATTDARVKSIFDYITTDPDFAGKTAIVLTADHGGEGPSHLDPEVPGSYTIPMFLWGPGIPAGVDLYTLVTNRFNPGESRPDHNAAQQPLRNGDTGNLSLALLGLPSIPGSWLVPELSLTPPRTPGDADGSGTVDRTDLAALAENFGAIGGASWADGDFNMDGWVSLTDLRMLQSNLEPPPGSAPVPEPSTLAMLLGVVFAMPRVRHLIRRLNDRSHAGSNPLAQRSLLA